MQNEAARIVTGTTRLVSINLLHSETGWDSLARRRNNHKIIMFHKMYTGLSPAYLSALIPATIGANVSYNLRNPNNLQTVRTMSISAVLQVLYEHGTPPRGHQKHQYYCITEIEIE